MSTIPSSLNRVSSAMTADLLRGNLRRTNAELLRVQNQLSSGLKIERPSDDPRYTGAIGSMRTILELFDQQLGNLGHAADLTDVTDAALGDATDLLMEAKNVASSQIGLGSSPEERASQAAIVDGLIDTLLSLSNREHNGVHLLAGRAAADPPFSEQLGGVRYTGSREQLTGDLGEALRIGVNLTGDDALGALSGRVNGAADLDPLATADTRIGDVNGARASGVKLGVVKVTVNGATAEVDLRSADTLGDVADRINAALGAAGSLAVDGNGYTLTAAPGEDVSIADISGGVTAADLGIELAASDGGSNPAVGADIDPRLTPLTDPAMLGAVVDLSGGLKITNGGATKVVDFSGAANVQEMIDRIAAAGIGARLEINAEGTGLNLVNEVSGTTMSVGENGGGTTATDLGLRSFAETTRLDEFNHGLGVRIDPDDPDFRIELRDGTGIEVDLAGAGTVQDVLDAINSAGGGSVTAALAADGNGLVLTDNMGGGGTFRVKGINGSFAAADLGIEKQGNPQTILGDDTAAVRTDSAFTHLIMLRDALLTDDQRALTLAGEKLEGDIDRIASARAGVGVRANRIESERGRAESRKIQTAALLSGIRDTDMTEAVTRFTQLAGQLEANLLAGRQMLGMSLLDFLR